MLSRGSIDADTRRNLLMRSTVNGPKNAAIWKRADAVIPGGGIFRMRSARFAGNDVMPGFIEHADGCRLTDVDGQSYIDFNCGNGPNLLGYRHPEVDAAAEKQAGKVDLASFFNEVMVEYAEKLITWSETFNWAILVKNGSDSTNLAMRVMRSQRQRPLIILFSAAYHGFGTEISLFPEFAADESTRHIIRLPWNDANALKNIITSHGDQVSGIMLNPLDQNPAQVTREASSEFIAAIDEFRESTGALVAVDDVRNGFRLHAKGSHHHMGIEPDLLCLGKALGNGYAVSALLGKDPLREAVERVQLTATYMFSAVAHQAGIKSLEIYERDNVLDHINIMGRRLVDGLTEAGRAAGHEDVLLSGPVTMPVFLFKNDIKAKRARTFGQQAALRGAIFHPTLNWFLCYAHKEKDIDEAISIAAEAFRHTPAELA
jgi:glutamate-1-semialdehyde 2,1-aminomutase